MKLTIDTGGDEADTLLARAYLAAVVGPSRRPFGRVTQIPVPVGEFVELFNNATGARVVSVTVSSTQAGNAFQFAQTGGGGPAFGSSLGNGPQQSLHFVLMPGEILYAAGTIATPVSVFSNSF
jgi:hypothetical protein